MWNQYRMRRVPNEAWPVGEAVQAFSVSASRGQYRGISVERNRSKFSNEI